MIGVLVITDDGNINNQDIVFGEYRTSCIRKYFLIKLRLFNTRIIQFISYNSCKTTMIINN